MSWGVVHFSFLGSACLCICCLRLLFLEIYPVELQAQVSRGYSSAIFLIARKEKATSAEDYVHFIQMHLLPNEVNLYVKLGRTAMMHF